MIGLFIAVFFTYRSVFGFGELTSDQSLALAIAVILEGIAEWIAITLIFLLKKK